MNRLAILAAAAATSLADHEANSTAESKNPLADFITSEEGKNTLFLFKYWVHMVRLTDQPRDRSDPFFELGFTGLGFELSHSSPDETGTVWELYRHAVDVDVAIGILKAHGKTQMEALEKIRAVADMVAARVLKY